MSLVNSHWWSSPGECVRALLMLDDTRHSIALGTAVGIFVGLTPTVGVQTLLVLVIAFLSRPFFRFNRIAALISVFISNPFTTPPLYYLLYRVGSFFVGGDVARDDFESLLVFDSLMGWFSSVTELFDKIGQPMLIGTVIVATIGGGLTYPLMRFLLGWFHGDAR